MPLLFKSKSKKVLKKQTGGTIPFYAPYQVQMAQTPVANPAALLKVYASAAPSESKTETKSADKSPIEDEDWKPKGLQNEQKYVVNQYIGLKKKIQGLIDAVGYDEAVNSPTGHNLLNQMNALQTISSNTLIENQKTFEKNKVNVESKGGLSEYMYHDGLFTVQDLETQEIKQIKPEDLAIKYKKTDGVESQKYVPLTYAEGFEARETVPSDGVMFNANFLTKLGAGQSVNYVATKVIQPSYSGIGFNATDSKLWVKDKSYDLTESTIKSIMTGKYDKDNEKGLVNAFNVMMGNLSPQDKNTLMGSSWLTAADFQEGDKIVHRLPRTAGEAEQGVRAYLINGMQQHIDSHITDITRIADEETPIKPTKDASSGGSSNEMSEQSYLLASLGTETLQGKDQDLREVVQTGDKVAIKTVIDAAGNAHKQKQNLLTSYPRTNSQFLRQNLVDIYATIINKIGGNTEKAKELQEERLEDNPYITYNELATTMQVDGGLNPFATNLKDAIFQDGNKVSTVMQKDTPEGWQENIKFMPDEVVATGLIPIDKTTGKPWDPDGKQVMAYNDKVAEFLKSIYDDNTKNVNIAYTNSDGTPKKEKINEELKKLSDEFYAKIENKNVTMKPYYFMQAILEVDANMNAEVNNIILPISKAVGTENRATLNPAKVNNFLRQTTVLIPVPDVITSSFIEKIKLHRPKEESTVGGIYKQQTQLDNYTPGQTPIQY